MKKITVMASLVSVLLVVVACGGSQEEKTDKITQDSIVVIPDEAAKAASDTTTFACTCEHKCATKEECLKHCGEGCQAQE